MLNYVIVGLLIFIAYKVCLFGKVFDHLSTLEEATSLQIDMLRHANFSLNDITTKVEQLSKKIMSYDKATTIDEYPYREQLKAIHSHLQSIYHHNGFKQIYTIYELLTKKKKNG